MYRYRCVLFRYHTLLKFALPLCSYQIRESMNETRWDNIDLWWWRMTIAAGGTQEAGEDPDHPECWCWSGDILGAPWHCIIISIYTLPDIWWLWTWTHCRDSFHTTDYYIRICSNNLQKGEHRIDLEFPDADPACDLSTFVPLELQ